LEVLLARPLRVELTGAVYHVIARGNERKAIFRDDRDRVIYLERLSQCRSRFQFQVLGYCLMDNHVHLALERGPVALSRVMLALQSFYAQKFNFRHQRVGHLFQGRYKAFLIQDERYLFALLRYIHLNPVRARIVHRPEAYPWSSDRFYREGKGLPWLDVDVVLGKLAQKRDEALVVYQRLMARRDQQAYEDVATFGAAVKGDLEFAERALVTVGEARRMPSAWTPESLAESVALAEGLSLEHLKQPRRSVRESRVRLTAAYLGRRHAGFSIARMARCFGREESTFNRGVRRLEDLINRDESIRTNVERIASSLRSRNTGIHD
jgi:REP element-mobilizing transposase RayT